MRGCLRLLHAGGCEGKRVIQWRVLASSSPEVCWLVYLCWHVYWCTGWIAYDADARAVNSRGPLPPPTTGEGGGSGRVLEE